MNVGNHLSESLRHTVDDLFRRYDKDNSGTLEWNEVNELLVDAFKILGGVRQVTSHDVKSFSETVDVNGDGRISKAELYNIFRLIEQKRSG